MPAAFVFRIEGLKDQTPPPLGAALHAIFLDWTASIDPEFAKTIHDAPKNKPFTLSSFMPDPSGGLLWRWTALDAKTRELMLLLAQKAESNLKPAGIPCQMGWLPEHPWAGHRSFEELHRSQYETEYLLHFLTPTAFRQNGRDLPLPLPRLLIKSYLERWNAWAPFPLPSSLPDEAEKALVLKEVDISTQQLQTGKIRLTGFTGKIRLLIAPQTPSEVANALSCLLRFGSFCGSGAKTALGFGVTLPSKGYLGT